MASVIVNTANSLSGGVVTAAVSRGRRVNLGTLVATASVVQFGLVQEGYGTDGLDVLAIATSGGTITAPTLTASIDQGVSWFTVSPRAAAGTAPNYTATALNGDTAASSANAYDVSGLQNATFRFGSTGITGTPVVWAMFG